MKKHRVGKFLSSVFGSHIDHGHSELLEEKEGSDKVVEKILKLIKTVEKEDDSASGSELVSLVEEFHENFNSLYRKYDGLVEKLKEHTQQKKEMNGDLSAKSSSDSDSSSSDSDRSPKSRKKHGKHNGMELTSETISAEEDLTDLKMQVEILKKRNLDYDMETSLLLSKIEECQNTEDELGRREADLKNLEEELGRTRENFKVLQDAHESLKLDLEAIKLHHADVTQRLENSHEEKEALLSQKLHAENSFEVLKMENSLLEEGFTKLQNENQSLNLELDRLNKQAAELDSQLTTVKREKDELGSELASALSRIVASEKAMGDLKNDASMSLKLANEKSAENSQLLAENDLLKQSISSAKQKINDAEQELTALQEEKITLNSEISSVHTQLLESQAVCEKLRLECELLKDAENKLCSDNSNLNEDLRIRGEELNALSLNHAVVVEKLLVAEKQAEVLNLDLNSLNESKIELMGVLEGVKEEMNALKEENKALSSEKSYILDKLSDAEKFIKELMAEKEALGDSLSKLQSEIVDAKQENAVHSKNIDDFRLNLATKEEEKSMILNRLSDTEKLVEELKTETMNYCNEIAALNDKLEEEVKNVADLGSQLSRSNQEKQALLSEKLNILSKLEEEERTIEDLKMAVQDNLESAKHKTMENANLLEENEGLKHKLEVESKERSQLEEELNARKEDISALNNKCSIAEEEAKKTLKAIEEQMMDLQLLRENKLKLLEMVSDLEHKMREKDEDNAALSWKYTESVDQYKSVEGHNEMLLEDLEKQTEELARLSLDYDGMKEDFISSDNKVSELEGLLDTMSEEKKEMNIVTAAYLDELEKVKKSTYDLENEAKYLDSENSKLRAKVDELSRNMKEVEDEKNLLVAESLVNREQMRILQADLEKKMEEKRDEMYAFQNEIVNLNVQVEKLEIQLHQSFQKLQLSETEQKEKDEVYKKKIEELQEEHETLENQHAKLQEKAQCLEDVLKHVKKAMCKQLARVDDMGLVFEDTFGLLHAKLFNCSEEMKAVKLRVNELILKKEALEQGNIEWSRRVGHLEGIVAMLKEEIDCLKENLKAKIEEAEKLAKSVDGYEVVMPELQEQVKKLEKETVFKDEEKREAIRQLCLLIEYHRENYEYLYHLLSSNSSPKVR